MDYNAVRTFQLRLPACCCTKELTPSPQSATSLSVNISFKCSLVWWRCRAVICVQSEYYNWGTGISFRPTVTSLMPIEDLFLIPPTASGDGVRWSTHRTHRTLDTCGPFQSIWMSSCCSWYWCLRLNNLTQSDKKVQSHWVWYWHFSPHRLSWRREIMTIGCLHVLLQTTFWHKTRKHGYAYELCFLWKEN